MTVSSISRNIPWFWRFASSAVIVISLLGLWWLLEVLKPVPVEKERKVKKVKVFVQTVTAKPTRLLVESQGQAQPNAEIQLRSQVEGRVTAVSNTFVAGGSFTKGDVLITLDPQDYQLLVIQRQAKVQQTQEALERITAESANAIAELTLLNRDNASPLAKKLPQLSRAEADLASAQAALKQAQLNLQRTQIIAPFDGMVRAENVAVGQFITRATVLGNLFSTSEMEIRLPLRGEELSQLGLPLNYFSTPEESLFPVTLTTMLGAIQGQWLGHIVRTEGALERATRTMYAVVHVNHPYDVSNDQMPLVAGMYVDAEIQGRLVDNAVTVPRKAIRTNNKLWLVDKNNSLNIVPVDVISRNHQHAVVLGVEGKQRVVTSALVMAVEGQTVRAINPNRPTLSQDGQGTIVPESTALPVPSEDKDRPAPKPQKLKGNKIGGAGV